MRNIQTIQVEGMYIDFNERIIEPAIVKFIKEVKHNNLQYTEECLKENDDVEDTLKDELTEYIAKEYRDDVMDCLLHCINIEIDLDDLIQHLKNKYIK